MSLATSLVTNEIKNDSAVEVEFERLGFTGDRGVIYKKLVDNPALPQRLILSHQEIGSGVDKRRRSLQRFEITLVGGIDATRNVKGTISTVIDLPVGNLTSDAMAKLLLAYQMSFQASFGASTTILYDCTGNGAAALVAGTL